MTTATAPRKQVKRQRTDASLVRLLPSEAAILREAAARQGKPLARFLRDAAMTAATA